MHGKSLNLGREQWGEDGVRTSPAGKNRSLERKAQAEVPGAQAKGAFVLAPAVTRGRKHDATTCRNKNLRNSCIFKSP